MHGLWSLPEPLRHGDAVCRFRRVCRRFGSRRRLACLERRRAQKGGRAARRHSGGFPRRHSGGFPRRHSGGFPRRHRRGLSALTATLLVSLALAVAFAGFTQSQALRLRDAQATRLEQWTRQEARALHLWLHEVQGRSGFRLPGSDDARAAGNSGSPPTGLVANRAPWAAPPRGFLAHYAVTNPGVQANNPNDDPDLRRAHGIVVVSVGNPGAVGGNHRYLLTALCRALAASKPSVIRAEALAKRAFGSLNFGGPSCDIDRPGRAVALFAAPLSGIDPDLVLREPRSGFAPTVMQTALHMGGHALSDVGAMTVPDAGGIEAPVLEPLSQGGAVAVSGNLTVEGGFSAGHLRARSAQVAGGLDVEGQLTTGGQADSRLDVTGRLGDRRAVRSMTLSGPGPVSGVRTLSVRRCRPSANCGGGRSGVNHGN